MKQWKCSSSTVKSCKLLLAPFVFLVHCIPANPDHRVTARSPRTRENTSARENPRITRPPKANFSNWREDRPPDEIDRDEDTGCRPTTTQAKNEKDTSSLNWQNICRSTEWELFNSKQTSLPAPHLQKCQKPFFKTTTDHQATKHTASDYVVLWSSTRKGLWHDSWLGWRNWYPSLTRIELAICLPLYQVKLAQPATRFGMPTHPDSRAAKPCLCLWPSDENMNQCVPISVALVQNCLKGSAGPDLGRMMILSRKATTSVEDVWAFWNFCPGAIFCTLSRWFWPLSSLMIWQTMQTFGSYHWVPISVCSLKMLVTAR